MKTTFSRRELYALGEPIGNSATTKKLGGGRIYGMGGGGSGGGPTQSTSYQTNIPEYAQPYVETMLGATQKQLFQGTPTEGGGFDITGFQPYKAYGGTYDESGKQTSYDPSKGIAGFQPMQTTAQQGVANMQVPGEYGQASGATQQAMQNLQNANYQGGNFNNQFRSPGQYQPGQFSMAEVQAPDLQNFQMDPAERVGTQSFAQPGSAEAYMSPYMQNVVDIQKREAQRQSGIQGTQQQAQATQSGAFGGSRDAIMRAERERNLGQQMGDIQATGSQAAFQQAQQQFNAEQQARLQAQQANQQAGLTVGGQNLAARLGVQQIGAGQNLQAQLANQQTLQAAQQAQEQSRQFGAGQGMTAAQQRAQYGLAGQQLGEQSRQFGAGYGLQANQAALGAANQLAGIGGQRLQAQQGIYGLQNQMGAQQQAQQQQILNQAMQDYANAQQYPLMQLGTMSNMIRGLPMQAQTTQQYVAQPNTLTQAIGAAGTGASLYNAFNPSRPGGAAGGLPSEFKYSKGGGIMSYDVGGEVESYLENMDEQGLQKQLKESSSPSVKRMAQRILRERQMSKAPGMAGGGIIAFNTGNAVKAEEEYRYDPFGAMTQEQKDARKNIDGLTLAEERAKQQPQPTAGQTLQQRVMQGKPTGDVTAQPAGIMQAAPTPPAAPPATLNQAVQGAADLTPAMKALQTDVAREAAVSYEDRLAEVRAAKKAAGLEEPGIEQKARLMAERANAEDEARRNRYLRAAEFFSTWGSTPGPTLSAGMSAVKANVANIISDEKEAKRIRMEIDKSIAGLDEATRLEKKGDFEAATALKTKYADRMQAVNLEIIKIQEDEAKGVRADKRAEAKDIRADKRAEEKDVRYGALQKEITQMKIDADAANNKTLAKFRAEDKAEGNTNRLITLYTSAQSDKAAVESRISNIMKSEEYQRALTDSNMKIDEKSSPETKRMQANAAEALKGFNDSFKTQRETADNTAKFMEERLSAKGVPLPANTQKPKPGNRPALDDPTLQKP